MPKARQRTEPDSLLRAHISTVDHAVQIQVGQLQKSRQILARPAWSPEAPQCANGTGTDPRIHEIESLQLCRMRVHNGKDTAWTD